MLLFLRMEGLDEVVQIVKFAYHVAVVKWLWESAPYHLLTALSPGPMTTITMVSGAMVTSNWY